MPSFTHSVDDARNNKLLAALPDGEWARIRRHLEPVSLEVSHVLSEPGAFLRDVYFPTSAVISLLYLTLDGATTEVSAVGSEGLFGLSAFMGGGMMPARSVVQTSGQAWRLSAVILRKEFQRGGVLQRQLLLYALASLAWVAQTAVCNQHHSVDQRLTRWLLLSFDRFASNEMLITHDLISKSLGIRREGVTEATGRMQRSGLITLGRGRLTIANRQRLEATCCECYGAIRREYARLLGRHLPTTGRAPLLPTNVNTVLYPAKCLGMSAVS